MENADCPLGRVCDARVCVDSSCGDGIIDERAGEQCDDQDSDETDGCRSDCSSPLDVFLTQPLRGETLSGVQEIAVTGNLDSFGAQITSLTINGAPATFDGVNFQATLPARHGLNTVRVEAVNEHGRSVVRTAGVYHSSAYLPFSQVETSTSPLPAGIVSRLGQAAFDDGDHPCSFDSQGTYSCTVVDDLATVGELVLNNLDVESEFGSLPLYTRSFPLFERRFDLGSTTFDLGGLQAVIAGDIVLRGVVNLRVEIYELDFDRLSIDLATRTGGLDVDIAAGGGFNPGVVTAVRSVAEVDAALRFESVTGSIEGFDALGLACLLLPTPSDPVAAGILASLCIQSDGQRAPLAGVQPFAQLNSDFSVEQVSLFTGFNVDTAIGGGVNVQLLNGDVDFMNSNVDLNLISDMIIDFDDAVILGGAAVIDLGEIPLSGVAQGLASFVDPLSDRVTNDLQALVQVGFNAFLLNRDDPLALGTVLENTILS
ncbi:MAG: hypothetical protein AAFQ82_13365, partial [Myxococcota bacterium]